MSVRTRFVYVRRDERAVDMQFSAVQGLPGKWCSGWRYGVALAALLVAASAQAQWVIPAGSGWDMGGGSSDLGCTDLIVEGTLTVGSGGSITGVSTQSTELKLKYHP